MEALGQKAKSAAAGLAAMGGRMAVGENREIRHKLCCVRGLHNSGGCARQDGNGGSHREAVHGENHISQFQEICYSFVL